MTRKGLLVWKMPDDVYRTNIGRIRCQFSNHVRIDIERKANEKGEKIVEIWSMYPETVKNSIEEVLGKRK